MASAADEPHGGADTLSPWRSRARSAISGLTDVRSVATPLDRGWAIPVLLLWIGGRSVNFVLLATAFLVAKLGGWTLEPDGRPTTTFLDFLSGWDAHRYAMIAAAGYPVALPLDPQGTVEVNNWAFLPVFPFLERVVSDATATPWQFAGVVLSVGASCAATLVLYALLRRVTVPRAAWWAVVLFSFGPVSFILVLGYAESLSLLLIFSALLLAVRRKYLLITPLGVMAAFTRPGALALSLALGILLLVRIMRRREDPISRPQMTGLVVSALATAAASFAWPIIADAATGRPGAYIQTEMAWWVPYLGGGRLIPLVPGVLMGWTWLGAAGALTVIVITVALFRWILSAPVRALGLEIVAYVASYVLYLFVVFLPTQSIVRVALPLSPLLADSRLSATRRRRLWTIGISISLQAAAVYFLWTVGNP